MLLHKDLLHVPGYGGVGGEAVTSQKGGMERSHALISEGCYTNKKVTVK